MLISTAQARAELASKKSQFRRHRFTGCSCTLLVMDFILHGRCKEILSCGNQKREFMWQVQGIGHVAKIMAGAIFRGRYVAKTLAGVSFEGRRESGPWILCLEVEGLNS